MATEIALDIQMNVQSQHRDIELNVSRPQRQMTLKAEKSTTPIEEYAGPYHVVPRLYYGHLLETKGKLMAHDTTVASIPIYEVSNPMGGKTVTIGSI